jgi:hypothetical protein
MPVTRTLHIGTTLRSPCEKCPVVEFPVVEQDVRIGVGGDRELPLTHEGADLGPRAALPVQQ